MKYPTEAYRIYQTARGQQAGLYIKVSGMTKPPVFMMSVDLGPDMGFQLYKHEETSDSSMSTYRLIGSKRATEAISCCQALICRLTPATEEEVTRLERIACEC